MFPRQYVQVYSRLFQYFKVKEAKYDFLYVIFDIFEEKLRMALANDWKKISRLSMYGCFLWMVVCSFFFTFVCHVSCSCSFCSRNTWGRGKGS